MRYKTRKLPLRKWQLLGRPTTNNNTTRNNNIMKLLCIAIGLIISLAAVCNIQAAHVDSARDSVDGTRISGGVKDERNTQTLRNELEVQEDGNYRYAYETSNGISAEEHGQGGVAVQGSSSYTSPEGIEIKVSYIADETGYHPVGDHIPKTPDYILRALEYIRTHPYQVRDYYSGVTKQVSHDHEAFKAVTRNTLIPTRTATTTAATATNQRRPRSHENKPIDSESHRRGTIKYYNNNNNINNNNNAYDQQ